MSRRVIVSSLALLAGLVVLWAWAPGAVQADRKPNNSKPDPNNTEDGGQDGKRPQCAGDTPTQSDGNTGFVEVPSKDKYVAFIPRDYDKDGDKKYPVILFLHGHGAEGKDGWLPTKTGLGPAILEMEDDFEFIVLFPQARKRWHAF
jgi:hypothetical protein